MADIFLSYKAEDRARVKPLVDAFVAEGLSVWWDLQVEGGAAWRETIVFCSGDPDTYLSSVSAVATRTASVPDADAAGADAATME